MTKIRSKNSLYHHRYFTEHLVCAFRKSPPESFDPVTQEQYRLHLQGFETLYKIESKNYSHPCWDRKNKHETRPKAQELTMQFTPWRAEQQLNQDPKTEDPVDSRRALLVSAHHPGKEEMAEDSTKINAARPLERTEKLERSPTGTMPRHQQNGLPGRTPWSKHQSRWAHEGKGMRQQLLSTPGTPTEKQPWAANQRGNKNGAGTKRKTDRAAGPRQKQQRNSVMKTEQQLKLTQIWAQ
jgi:hypothetical protein